MKPIAKVLTLIIAGLMSLSAFSQTKDQPEAITLNLKVYLESEHSFKDMADNLTIRMDEMIDRTITEQENKDGRLSLALATDKHYVLYFSQEGFETKSMVFSTVGADKESKYIFRADIMLKKSSVEQQADHNSMASVRFDYINKNEFVINDNYSRIQLSIKK